VVGLALGPRKRAFLTLHDLQNHLLSEPKDQAVSSSIPAPRTRICGSRQNAAAFSGAYAKAVLSLANFGRYT
jgi:hypothetical protein